MSIALTRRGMLQLLGFGAVAAAAVKSTEAPPVEPVTESTAVDDGSVECTYRGKPLMSTNAGCMRFDDVPLYSDYSRTIAIDRRHIEVDSDAQRYIDAAIRSFAAANPAALAFDTAQRTRGE